MSTAQAAALGGTHNALLYLPPPAPLFSLASPPLPAGGATGGGSGGPAAAAPLSRWAALGASSDAWAAVDADYVGQRAAGRAPVVVIDGVLSPTALAALYAYCLEATV